MDVLYDNLENYNEVNVVEELLTENKELKQRVKEYEAAMQKLQLEFDKLTTEYKKLEINYSSLLKTAKAEIERKTTTITNLNIDKDRLLINAMQTNKNFPRSNIQRERFKGRGKSEGDKRNSKRKEVSVVHKAKSTNNGGNKDCLPSEETVSSHNTDKLCTNNRALVDRKTYTNRMTDSKENVKAFTHIHKDDRNNDFKPKPLNIKNRRKSMPVLGKEFDKFSSDEDFEEMIQSDIGTCFSAEAAARKFLEKNYCDRNNKPLESSREKYNKPGFSRNYDSDRYRSRYDQSQMRRRNSPERYHRELRDYSDDANRADYGRYRGEIESPPPEKYFSERIRNPDRRNYKRNHDEHRYHQMERYPGKQNNRKDYNEPYSKKAKTDYKHDVDEERWNKDIIPPELQANHNVLRDEFQESCQSPDYIDSAHSAYPIKEIMSTAEVQLEDPRSSSNKYIRNIEDNNRIIFSTVIGRNVDLKLVNKTRGNWDKCPELPKALMQPLYSQEEFVSDLYKDIDNPIASFSPESEEVEDFNMDKPILFNIANHHKNCEEFYKQNSVTGVEIASNVNNCLNSKHEVKSKMKEFDKQSTSDSVKFLGTNPTIINNHFNDSEVIRHSSNLENENLNQENTGCNENIGNICVGQRNKRIIVEDDLELSDETSDHIMFKKNVLNVQDDIDRNNVQDGIDRNTTNKNIEIANNTTHCKQDDIKEKICNKNVDLLDVNLHKDIKESPSVKLNIKSQKEITSFLEDIKHLNVDENKKDKIKKRSQKPKGKIAKDPLDGSKASQYTPDSKLNPKKEKELTEKDEIKTKFSELFGDTNSSLITPEDLGITSQVKPSDYVPLSEDAQDAVDVKAKCSEKVQTRLAKAKAEDTAVGIIETNKGSNEKLAPKHNKASKVNSESKKNKTKKKEAESLKDKINMPNVNNNNAEPKDINSVVRTEIISSGIQLNETNTIGTSNTNCNPESHAHHDVQKASFHPEPCLDNESQKALFPHPNISALATSTPAKKLPVENNEGIKDNSVMATSLHDESSNTTMDSQTETDLPDLRIVMKRRRKVVKRPVVSKAQS